MLLFRSLTVGLLGACVLLLVRLDMQRGASPAAAASGPTIVVSTPPAPVAAATIVDVGAGLQPEQLAALVHLGPGEHVATVDDRAVASDLDAGTMIAQLAPGARSFIDLDVAAESGAHRRVLVLRH